MNNRPCCMRKLEQRSYFFMRNSTYLSPANRDWGYFFKRYIDLPPEVRAHIIVQMAIFAPHNASLHPSYIVWVNHTEDCRADYLFQTQFGSRFHCSCPRAIHTSPLPIAGPVRRDGSCSKFTPLPTPLLRPASYGATPPTP